ncbi:hypothetical protein ACQKOH_22400 [Sphingomonas sp. NPDC092331]|jgi:hypothetical protein|uniref:hypothetical protein n=1 Tax=unclassified Sphingomonas TaxID=196159 RepID=UPI0024583B45|nr:MULTISPECIES: hypothetical protein [unclassified Sphingomonas]MBQ1500010.1 hypothetical protein [Sphingomonas sp.]MDH4745556.1 hypothetical protein [Sphingomonas sp. CBMAI 2297]
MANVDGSWNTVVKSPLGDQAAVFTVTTDGDTFTGTFAGAMGNAEAKGGKVDGDKLSWTMDVSVPMPMTLTGEATVDGDSMAGTVTAGAFGAFPLTGTRA